MTILSKLRDFFNRPIISINESGPGLMQVTVQKGDTLSGLAKRHLGDANRWREIWNLNVTAIGNNPDKIYPGTVLMLPRKDKP